MPGAQSSPQPEPEKSIPSYLKISAAILLVSIVYLGYIFYSRAQQAKIFEAREAAQKAQQSANDQKAVEGMGGDKFAILNFYADPAAIAPGDATELCYGVSNATKVTLVPQPNAVWPAFSKCVSVSPRKTTAYTLTATDAAGHTAESRVTVNVQ
jgi:hypothetical protein